jgi:hypothetical protein
MNGRGHILAGEFKYLPGLVEGKAERAGDHFALHGVEPELESRHDAEVTATTAHGPEEIRVFIRAGVPQCAIGGDDVDRKQVIDGKPEAAREPPESAAQRETPDARVGYASRGGHQAVCHGLGVQVAQQAAAGHPRGALARIDPHAA